LLPHLMFIMCILERACYYGGLDKIISSWSYLHDTDGPVSVEIIK
jgi:hypothetical protein